MSPSFGKLKDAKGRYLDRTVQPRLLPRHEKAREQAPRNYLPTISKICIKEGILPPTGVFFGTVDGRVEPYPPHGWPGRTPGQCRRPLLPPTIETNSMSMQHFFFFSFIIWGFSCPLTSSRFPRPYAPLIARILVVARKRAAPGTGRFIWVQSLTSFQYPQTPGDGPAHSIPPCDRNSNNTLEWFTSLRHQQVAGCLSLTAFRTETSHMAVAPTSASPVNFECVYSQPQPGFNDDDYLRLAGSFLNE